MSPTMFHPTISSRSKSAIEINGPRPSPLKLDRNSHVIQKSSTSLSLIFSSSDNSLPVNNPKQIQKPVIIYARSPKIIHTQPKDFMALVQRLTGHDSSRPKDNSNKVSKAVSNNREDRNIITNESSSSLSEETRMVSPIMNPPKEPHFADIPLFTPNSTDRFFCSPKPLLRFSGFSSPNNLGGTTSPTVLKLFKDLPDY
ncbi:VQ motif-containing protein 8, chloroplastic-like [Rutidosis leptorrhynchoides]|uniref:VQ motif-containing protein 8, chloroplastic-like n=1 Tax=Rutidosis leptorrhynchoides TaxID=125765 RepID=UPI003A99D8F4